MGLKLLSKKEIDQAKGLEKKAEIDEGRKLAARVDGLRELVVEEQEKMDKWRISSIAAIQDEISGFVASKESLKSEVNKLRKEKERGLSEVAEERTKLEFFKKSLDERALELVDLGCDLDIKSHKVSADLEESKNELERARSHTEEAQRLHLKASEEEETAGKKLSIAKSIEEKALNLRKDAEYELGIREQNILARERDCEIKEIELKNKEKELITQKLRIEDREGMLERSIQRMKDGKRP